MALAQAVRNQANGSQGIAVRPAILAQLVAMVKLQASRTELVSRNLGQTLEVVAQSKPLAVAQGVRNQATGSHDIAVRLAAVVRRYLRQLAVCARRSMT